jgi:P4 family phage/plasmid primase-like protien
LEVSEVLGENITMIQPPNLEAILDGDINELAPQDLVLTDAANGRVFIEMHGDYVRYSLDTERWHVWNGKRWAEDTRESHRGMVLAQATAQRRRDTVLAYPREDPTEQNRILQTATQLQNVAKMRSMLTIAASDPRIQVLVGDFDQRLGLLNAQNGAVDLYTGELVESLAPDMHSCICEVNYIRDAAKPGYSKVFEEFLSTFLPDEDDQRFIFAMLGHSLFRGNARRILPIIWGETTSGKSQFMSGVHKVLGSYVCTINASVFRGALDDKPRPDLVAAMYKRIVWASEASKNWSLHADQVKRLTGGEPIPYRNLYQGMVQETPRFTPFIVTNAIPHIIGLDTATKRRVLVIHFDRSLPKALEDPNKREVFLNDAKCLEALLARMVYGARDDIIDVLPAKYVLATMSAHGEMDSIDEFLTWATGEEKLLKVDPDSPRQHMIKADEMHKLYQYWLKNYADVMLRKDQLSLRQLGQSLRDRGWISANSGGTRWIGWKLMAGTIVWA